MGWGREGNKEETFVTDNLLSKVTETFDRIYGDFLQFGGVFKRG